MIKLKARKVGNSIGLILPKEVTRRLKVAAGDTLFATECPDGYRISPYDPDFERQVKIAEEGMRKYRDVLRELAK